MDKAMNRDGLKRLWARAIATFGTATALNVTVVLPASGWSSTVPYTQTVAATGLLATDEHCPADVDMSGATVDNFSSLLGSWFAVGRLTTGNGALTAYCYGEKPTVDLTVHVKVVR